MNVCPEIVNTKRVDREGTSRPQRMLPMLDAEQVKVIDHSSADWMVFANRMAAHVNFFDLNNTNIGDWVPFFSKDASVLLAVGAVQRVDFYKLNLQGYLKYLLDSDHEFEVPELKHRFSLIFHCVGTLAAQLDFMQAALPPDAPLKGTLQSLIRSQLAEPFERLKLHYEAAKTAGLVITTPTAPLPKWTILGSNIVEFETTKSRQFSDIWTSGATWPASFGASILGEATGSVFERINFAAGHNLFTDILDQFLKVYARIAAEAKLSLEKTLTEQNSHEPHFALFLAFLRLLEFAKKHANTLTGRHLNFYYKEILQLKNRTFEPSRGHLLFELAKHKESHLLKKGLEFKAGKDSKGKPVAYKLVENFVANRAAVTRLQSLHFPNRLFAYPIANSKDGRGGELDSSDKQWDSFVRTDTESDLARVGFAIGSHYLYLKEGLRQIWLHLQLTIFPKKDLTTLQFCEAFDFFLTGPKGWEPAEVMLPKEKTAPLTSKLAIHLKLDGGHPPIVPLSAKVHGTDLPEGLPTLKAVLKQAATNTAGLKKLQSIIISPGESRLEIAVGYDDFNSQEPNAFGLKDLQIISKLGPIKPDKPFLPFGPLPEKGDALIIGSDEVMQKAGAKIQFQVKWKGLPDWRGHLDYDWVNEFTPRVQVQALQNGAWEPAGVTENGNSSIKIFDEKLTPDPIVVFPPKPFAIAPATAAELHFDSQSLGINSRKGYLRLELLGDFGHKLYQLTLPRYLMRVALQPATLIPVAGDRNPKTRADLRDLVYQQDSNGDYKPRNIYTFIENYVEHFSKAMPNLPYTPEIESFTLSYTASVNISDESVAFYHVAPFGYERVDIEPFELVLPNPRLRKAGQLRTGSSKLNVEPIASSTLSALQFDLSKIQKRQTVNLLHGWQNEGELFIGVENLAPPQNLSLLFQLAEGSADPTVLKPKNHVSWSYLSQNEWKPFSSTDFSDQTGQLTRSGIVQFSVPKDATKDNTLLLPTGLHWLRMTLERLPEAICKIISISAQAALAEFKDQENAPDYLAVQTPAGSITKLVVPDAAIKKVVQPYATFGGRQVEEDQLFYTRISERLRHKQRANANWDYEHLILEAFPQIFKVKCLNHTRFEPAETGKQRIYNELAPGHVTVVAIPNLQNRNAIDPLRPYTNLGDLERIKEFLQKHVSCFVNLHVHNPVYETVSVTFKVKFYPGVDKTFHISLLQNIIVRHLAPWAFGDSQDIRFGGKVYKSALIDLVEEQSFVDYVTSFQLFHQDSGQDLEEATVSTALAVLVPAEASKHSIEVITELETAAAGSTCRC